MLCTVVEALLCDVVPLHQLPFYFPVLLALAACPETRK